MFMVFDASSRVFTNNFEQLFIQRDAKDQNNVSQVKILFSMIIL